MVNYRAASSLTASSGRPCAAADQDSLIDIKPENLMCEDKTEHSAIKLTDFGLSAMVPLKVGVGKIYEWQGGSMSISVEHYKCMEARFADPKPSIFTLSIHGIIILFILSPTNAHHNCHRPWKRPNPLCRGGLCTTA